MGISGVAPAIAALSVAAAFVPGTAASAPTTKGRIVLLGYTIVRRGFPSAGLSRPDFRDMKAEIPRAPIGPGTDAVLLYLGGNDAQHLWLRPQERNGRSDAWIKWSDKEWSTVYEGRARALIDAVCSRGARTVVVLPPADVVDPKMQRRLERVRTLQDRAASASKCGRSVATTGDAGQFEESKTPLRGPDGVHMTAAGASRVWSRVGARVRRLIARRD